MHTERTDKLSKDIHLLNKSILKWERLAYGKASDDAIDDCALCMAYYKTKSSGLESCVGCPIRDNTGKQFCKGTPYVAWVKSLSDKYNLPVSSIFNDVSKNHAINMHNYLQELQAALVK